MQASSRSARELARIFSNGEDGDIAPEYQRGSVWTDEQRIGLVRSWLMGVPIPAVVINDRIFGPWPSDRNGPLGGYAYAVIDGKQRIETAIAWFNGELAVPASWFASEDVESTEETEDGSYVRYTGLVIAEQRHQGTSFQLPAVEAKVARLEEEAEIYLLVNGAGTPQSEESMANAQRVAATAETPKKEVATMTTNTTPEIVDLDDLATATVIELLLNPELGNLVPNLAKKLGLEITEAQEDLVDFSVLRLMDQLAIPFVESLPEEHRAEYVATLERRSKLRKI